MFGAIYIPLERSKYSDIDCVDVIQEDILKYNAGKNYKICLLGDFNARTGVKDDFIDVKDYVCNAVQLDNVTKQ